jgi:hypothetical protein
MIDILITYSSTKRMDGPQKRSSVNSCRYLKKNKKNHMKLKKEVFLRLVDVLVNPMNQRNEHHSKKILDLIMKGYLFFNEIYLM